MTIDSSKLHLIKNLNIFSNFDDDDSSHSLHETPRRFKVATIHLWLHSCQLDYFSPGLRSTAGRGGLRGQGDGNCTSGHNAEAGAGVLFRRLAIMRSRGVDQLQIYPGRSIKGGHSVRLSLERTARWEGETDNRRPFWMEDMWEWNRGTWPGLDAVRHGMVPE